MVWDDLRSFPLCCPPITQRRRELNIKHYHAYSTPANDATSMAQQHKNNKGTEAYSQIPVYVAKTQPDMSGRMP